MSLAETKKLLAESAVESKCATQTMFCPQRKKEVNLQFTLRILRKIAGGSEGKGKILT